MLLDGLNYRLHIKDGSSHTLTLVYDVPFLKSSVCVLVDLTKFI